MKYYRIRKNKHSNYHELQVRWLFIFWLPVKNLYGLTKRLHKGKAVATSQAKQYLESQDIKNWKLVL